MAVENTPFSSSVLPRLSSEFVEATHSPSPSAVVIAQGEVAPTIAPSQFGCFWKVFGSTFATIFLAELGDKTQVSTLLMSAEFHAPWTVFAGAAAALITTSLLGVLVGQWLSHRLSPRTLDTAAGLTLALVAIGLLWDVVGMM